MNKWLVILLIAFIAFMWCVADFSLDKRTAQINQLQAQVTELRQQVDELQGNVSFMQVEYGVLWRLYMDAKIRGEGGN